jgi:hypothetical protein
MSKSREYDQRYEAANAEVALALNAARAALQSAEDLLGLTAIRKEVSKLDQKINDVIKQSDGGINNNINQQAIANNDVLIIKEKKSALEKAKNSILDNKKDPLVKLYVNMQNMIQQIEQTRRDLIFENDARDKLEKERDKTKGKFYTSLQDRETNLQAIQRRDEQRGKCNELMSKLKFDLLNLNLETKIVKKLATDTHLNNLNASHEELAITRQAIEAQVKNTLNELGKLIGLKDVTKHIEKLVDLAAQIQVALVEQAKDLEFAMETNDEELIEQAKEPVKKLKKEQNECRLERDEIIKQNEALKTSKGPNVTLYNAFKSAINEKDKLTSELNSTLKNLKNLEALRSELGMRVNVYQAERIAKSDSDREKTPQAVTDHAWANLDLANFVYKEKQQNMIAILEHIHDLNLRAKMVIENKSSLEHNSIPVNHVEEKITNTYSNEQIIKNDKPNIHEENDLLENASNNNNNNNDDGLDDAINSMVKQHQSHGTAKTMRSDLDAAVGVINASKASLEQTNKTDVEHNPEPAPLAVRCK